MSNFSGYRTNRGVDASAWYKRHGELESMRFEELELKPYAEPVPPEELKNSETYFAVLFLDDDGLVPTLEPLVFIGRTRYALARAVS